MEQDKGSEHDGRVKFGPMQSIRDEIGQSRMAVVSGRGIVRTRKEMGYESGSDFRQHFLAMIGVIWLVQRWCGLRSLV